MECRFGKMVDRQQRAPNTAELPSNQDGERSDGEEELAPECEAGSEAQRSRGSDAKPGGSSTVSARLAEEPPRLNFHIPRRNKEKRALIQNLSSDSREFGEILKIITSSYKDPSSVGNFVYSKPRLVHNDLLEKEFIEKRKELKQDGRTDKELAESFCFLLCDAHKIPLICEKGLSVGSGWMTILGNASKGIYLCQFSDLLQVSPQEPGSTGEIIVFKVMKGKVKSIHDNMARTLDPTPKFDSHFSKNANRVTSLQSYRAFEYTQQYFYEYVDFELASRPRHVCPYAVISFQFKGKETTTVGPKLMPMQRSNSLTSGISKDNSGYIVWRGQFVNRGKEVYHSSLRSLSQPFLPFKLPDRVEIGKVMKLDQVKLSISCSLFSWDLYSGSHEVFKKGLHCSLFEVVVEKNKSMENLTQLFQKLEEEGLVLVNLVNDNGFFFLLSSNQMSNSNERRTPWKKSCGQALFIYRHARDVSKFSSKPLAASTPLLPVPQDPIMPHLDSFIPAFHYALGKVRCNPPANLGAGVEQQVHDYLSSIREGKLIQRVRLDYDHKLDEREKLFPAPRQKYNWENYVRSYFYNPHLFTMPVENAKKMVEELRCVPESSTDSETADGIEVHSDPERLKELLKLIQIKKNLAAKQKGNESDEGASDTHGLKRKSEDEANETSPKCMKMAPVNNRQPGEGAAEELQSSPSLTDVLSSIGLHDTDLRKDKTKGVLKVVKLIDKLSQNTHDTDLRKDNGSALVMKMLGNLSKIVAGSCLAKTDQAETVDSTKDTEATLYDSIKKLGLPTNCDIDLRKQMADDDQEAQGKTDLEKTPGRVRAKRAQVQTEEEETAGSLSSLEAFSPCSDTNGQQRGVNLLGEKSIPWVLIPITGLKTERYSHRRDENVDDPRYLQSPTVLTHASPEKKDLSRPDQPDSSNVVTEPELEAVEDENTNLTDELKVSHSQEQRGTPLSGVDCIVDEQISGFSTEVEDLLREECVYYIPYSSSQAHRNPPQTPMAPFSEYVSHFNTPLPVHSYIKSFRDSISAFIDSQQNTWDDTTHVVSVFPSSVSYSAPEVQPSDLPISSSLHIHTPLQSPSTVATVKPALASNLTSSSSSSTHPLIPSSSPTQSKQEQARLPHLDICKEVHQPPLQNMQRTNGQRQAEQSSVRLERQEGRTLYESEGEVSDGSVGSLTVEAQSRLVLGAGESMANSRLANESVAVEPAPAAISSLISQLQPEVISNLVKIIQGVQKNTVHFYIHSADEESDVCWEIKEYLKRLGNSECDPQTFLEKKDSQDKLLIIIQNIDIATHVHKIPALVSLKKLPSVSFAGVDSLDDIKNHTYNELFVSGGFIVSDEFVLNPDFIKQERLETLLQYLEELNTPESPWRWRVHCKTHKKVKEQSRCNSEALNILNLLTMYHKKQIVEFLSYHECDGQSRQAPDLNCLVKLQAQNIGQRHVIFLTERRFEMFPHYSSSGIVIANIDDILYNMASLIGEACDKLPSSNLHSCPTSPILREEEMNLGSEMDASTRRALNLMGSASFAPGQESGLTADPYACVLVGDKGSEVSLTSPASGASKGLDFEALKAAISQIRVARMHAGSSQGHLSQDSFNVNPHESFLGQGAMPSECSLLLDKSTAEVLSHESASGHSETSSTLEHATLSQDGAKDEACPGTGSTLRVAAVCGLNELPAPAPVVSPGTNFVVTETTSNISTDMQPTWNQTTDKDTATQISPKISGAESDCGQEKNASEAATSENLMLSADSSSTQSKDNAVTVMVGNGKHGSNAGLLPVPGTVAYGVNNTLVSVDRMLLQSSTLWPQGSVGLNSQGHPSQNGAIGLTSMANSLGMVTHSGLRGFLPNNNMQMAFNSLAQGAASNVWGVQQGVGLGPVHRAQFIQNYTWHSNPSFQGNGYPPRRGGFGGW